MTDKNEKPELKITVQAFSKYNDRNKVAAKQTNKKTQRNRKQQTKRILSNRHRNRLAVDKRKQRG